MTKRLTISKIDAKLLDGASITTQYVNSKNLSMILLELIRVRTSQINKCAYCLDIHTKLAIEAGETERRIFSLPAWELSPLFSSKEKAVLQMTEEIAKVHENGVTDQTYDELTKHFTDEEIAVLVTAAININMWNRFMLFSKVEHKN